MIMHPGIIVAFITIIAVCSFVPVLPGVEIPCPVVSETTLAQKAARWATAFQQPYCDYLQDYSALITRQTSATGILQAPGAGDIFRGSASSGEAEGANALIGISLRIKFKDPTTAEMASAKRQALRAGSAITLYEAGKKTFVVASKVNAALSGFGPTSLDFASREQNQKDAAKIAYMRGLVQSQELRILSLTRMLEALKKDR
jgi:hypothetical protein